MKRRLFSVLLILGLGLSLLPTTAWADTGDVTKPQLLGTVEEYQSTLDALYDENGLKVVTVGFFSSKGALGTKVGLMDQNGNWVAQPIYDSINPIAADYRVDADGVKHSALTAFTFIGGYTQCVRDGKMGLMNTKGEEVVPCQYDIVQMPSENMVAVYNKVNNDSKDYKYYLGYWDLNKQCEVVKPQKYITNYTNYPIYTHYASGNSLKSTGRQKPSGDYNNIHDFMDGYALVITSMNDNNEFLTATIIDKEGKEVLPKAYSISSVHLQGSYEEYPQKGTYLVIVEKKHQSEYNKNGKTMIEHDYIATGLAGKSGIIIPTAYTRGSYVKMNDKVYQNSLSSPGVYLEANLAVMNVAEVNGTLTPYGRIVFDLMGNVVLSARKDSFTFFPECGVLMAEHELYDAKGKKLASVTDGFMTDGGNGYFFGNIYGEYVLDKKGNDGYFPVTVCAFQSDGRKLDITKRMGWSLRDVKKYSKFSSSGYFWVENNDGKFGLLDFGGKEILPFEYDHVSWESWADQENGYAIVTKNGNQGLIIPTGNVVIMPSYDKVEVWDERTSAVLHKNDKIGLAEISTGKITLAVKYDGLLSFRTEKQLNPDFFGTGACVAFKGQDVVFVDRQGNEVYTRPYSSSQPYLNLTKEAIGGVYYVYEGGIDSRGRLLFPQVDQNDWRLDQIASTVIYQKDGKVYSQKANYLSADYKVKMNVAKDVTLSTEEIMELAMAYKAAFESARKTALANPYTRKAIYDKPVVKFVSTPTKSEYTVGEAFDTAGFSVQEQDIYGDGTDITGEITFDVNGVKIYDGYKFTTAGKKKVNCTYKGKQLNYFTINVYEATEEKELPLADGDYYIMVMDKYISPIGGNNWMELSDKKPSVAFTIKHLKVDKETGHHIYHVMINGKTVNIYGTAGNGAQLYATGGLKYPYEWRIAKYSSFWTMRDSGNQALVVNASGESSENGTKVILWNQTGSAPKHAKLQFIPAD